MSNSLTPLPMGFTEYAQYDGLGLAQLVHDGEIRAEELAQMAAAAVYGLNPCLSTVIEVWQGRVEQYDREADLASLFGGVPFFIKDLGVSEQGRLQEKRAHHLARPRKVLLANQVAKRMVSAYSDHSAAERRPVFW